MGERARAPKETNRSIRPGGGATITRLFIANIGTVHGDLTGLGAVSR